MTKNEEKALRVKYLRNLEKFSMALYLHLKEDFDKTKFEER
ncbi:hypothetical protein OLP59_05640, partial [Campylobacter jejuni]|nr:hypothetical protein [Campylobacter jejuni]